MCLEKKKKENHYLAAVPCVDRHTFRSDLTEFHLSIHHSLPTVKAMSGESHLGEHPIFYERTFIAEYNGERAGLVAIRFHGDPKER